MTDHNLADNWSQLPRKRADQQTTLSPNLEVGENNFPTNGHQFKSVTQQQDQNSQDLTQDITIENDSTENNSNQKGFTIGSLVAKLPRWTKSCVLWSILLTLMPSGIGFVSMSMLLKLPSAPNCPQIFWPLASASIRLHCASLAASKQNVNDLLQAIALVKDLPNNHPLRGQINDLLEQWSRDILDLADDSFQSGNLDEAIATVRQVPEDLEARNIVEEQVSKWQSAWSKGEDI